MKVNVDRACQSVNKGRTQIAAFFAAQHPLGGSVSNLSGGKASMTAQQMKAMDIAGFGGPDVLRQTHLPVPVPHAGEVLIAVVAAGVNRPDVLQRQGKYPVPPGASPIPGLEVAGTIVAVGPEVDEAMIGQKVCALLSGGGYADFAIAPAGTCLPVPAGLDLVEAAAIPETLFTVWTNLFERAYAVEGETVLVHGGTSGIGTMAISLCNLFGVHVIVTCGSDEKCARAREWGADHAINYRSADFVEAVKGLTDGRGVNAVLDMVGGAYLRRNIECLATDGRHVSIAMLGGAKGEVIIPEIMSRRLTITGSVLRPRSVAFKSVVADEIAQTVWPLVEEGRLRPAIDSRLPMKDAAAAHSRMEAGDHFGKIVLVNE